MDSVETAMQHLYNQKSSVDVYRALSELGIKGHPCSTDSCPIAMYLKKAAPASSVYAYPVGIKYSIDGTHYNTIPVSRAVRLFMLFFDTGTDYQDLTQGSVQ